MPSTRFINSLNQRLTNLPILPQVTVAPAAGESYPFGRGIHYDSWPTATTNVFHTWIAQDTPSGHNQAIAIVGGSVQNNCRYYVCDLASINWSGITLTGPRPRNPLGGLDPYTVSMGTMQLKTGAILVFSQTASERRQPFLVGNTIVEARKILPLCNAPTATNALDSLRYGGVTLVPSFFGDQWPGGGISVSRVGFGTSTGVTVYPVDPGTLIAQTAAGVNIGTVTAGTVRTFTEAELLAGGMIRWDFYFIGAQVGSIISLLSPLDMPPPYDCPGYDVPMLKGGYLT